MDANSLKNAVLSTVCFYWGAKIDYQYITGGKQYKSHNAIVNAQTLIDLNTLYIKEVKLYLYKIQDLKDEHFHEIMNIILPSRLGYIRDDEDENKIVGYNRDHWVEIDIITFSITIFSRNDNSILQSPNPIKVIDYLRLNQYDLNNLIDLGLAHNLKEIEN